MSDVRVTGEKIILQKIADLRKNSMTGSIAIFKALKTAATLVESQTKLNLRREKMAVSGFLMNSIRNEIRAQGSSMVAEIGSFGVVYARLHEMGGDFTPKMARAMMLSIQESGRYDKNYPGKDVAPDPRDRKRFRARPFLGPAYEFHKKRINELLQKAVMGEG